MGQLRVALLGKLRIQAGDEVTYAGEARKSLELFCYLLLHRRRPHHREVLAELFCDDCPGLQSKKALRQVLWQLQAALDPFGSTGEPPILLVEADWLQINPAAALWLDVAVLEEAFVQAQGVPGEALSGPVAAALHEAVDLYQAELLEGWYQDWCLLERERLHGMYLALLDKLMAYCEAQGDYEGGLVYGQRVLRYDRAHERTHQRLMRLYCLAGDRSAALRQGERCLEALRRDLDVKPSRRTLALLEEIRADRLPAPAAGPPENGAPHLTDVLANLEHLETNLRELHSLVRMNISALQGLIQRHDQLP